MAKEETAKKNKDVKPEEKIEPCEVEEMNGEQNVFSYGLGELMIMTDIENRIFYIDDEVTPDILREVTMFIIKANIQDRGLPKEERLPVKLVINSGGGSVLDGLGLIDTIKASITPVYSITIGYAFSMAFNIACACELRMCMPTSSFLCHDGSTGIFDSSTKFRDTVKFYDKIDERLDKIIASRSKLTIKELNDIKRQENFWLADDAKDLGIIDMIIGQDITIEEAFCGFDDCNCESCL